MVRDPSPQHKRSIQPVRRRFRFGRLGLRSLLVLLAIVLAIASPLAVLAQAQPPRSFRIVPKDLPDVEPEGDAPEPEVEAAAPP